MVREKFSNLKKENVYNVSQSLSKAILISTKFLEPIRMKNYDKEKYKIWNWKHPILLHWIINPGVAVSEFLGVVTPKVMLVEKNKTKSLGERTFIPCPHCETLHTSVKWSHQNNTHNKNWYGYHCDSCEGTIPPLRNWFSAIVFGAIKPFNKKNRERWKAAQPARFENLKLTFEAEKISVQKGLLMSLYFGGCMFVFMTLFNWFLGETINSKFIMVSSIAWLLGGLAFGFTMRAWFNYQIGKAQKQQQNNLEIDNLNS